MAQKISKHKSWYDLNQFFFILARVYIKESGPLIKPSLNNVYIYVKQIFGIQIKQCLLAYVPDVRCMW